MRFGLKQRFGFSQTGSGSTPIVVSGVTIAGTEVVNQTLTVSYTITGTPTVITRRWYRGATLIFTSTSSDTYVLTQAEAGNTSNITCNVDADGVSNATSNTIAQILDANALVYMQAVSIANNSTIYFASTAQERTGTQLYSYYNTFYIGLKSNNIYSKLKTIYRMRWGNAAQNKFNGVNPLDTDAAFRLVFSGTWTYDNFGSLPNGTNAFANSYFTPINHFSSRNSLAIIADINGGSLGGGAYPYTIGSGGSNISAQSTGMIVRATNKIGIFVGDANALLSKANSSMTGYFAVNSVGGATSIILNTTALATGTVSASGSLSNFSLYIGTLNVAGTPLAITYQNVKFRTILFADGLTLPEHNTLKSLIDTLNTNEGI